MNHSLGDGIKIIIYYTPGALTPVELILFLENVREKNAKKYARGFTEDIKALVKQLKIVVENYNNIKFKSHKMKEDITHILLVLEWLEESGSQGGDGNKKYEVNELIESDANRNKRVNTFTSSKWLEEIGSQGGDGNKKYEVNELIESDANRNSSDNSFTSSSGESPFRNRNSILGDDIKRIIHDNPGVVPPTDLIRFLEIYMYVSSKKVNKYSRAFTDDTDALVKQLKDIVKIYNNISQKSAMRKEVIKYILHIVSQLEAKPRASNEDKVNNTKADNRNSSFNASLSNKKESPKNHSLGADIKSVIKETPGVLLPTVLILFLETMSGEKDAKIYASEFTTDIKGLIKQLKEVKKNYNQKRIGDIMEEDINCILHVIKRLEASTLNDKETSATLSWDEIDSNFSDPFTLLDNYREPDNARNFMNCDNISLVSSENQRRENDQKREEERRSWSFHSENKQTLARIPWDKIRATKSNFRISKTSYSSTADQSTFISSSKNFENQTEEWLENDLKREEAKKRPVLHFSHGR